MFPKIELQKNTPLSNRQHSFRLFGTKSNQKEDLIKTGSVTLGKPPKPGAEGATCTFNSETKTHCGRETTIPHIFGRKGTCPLKTHKRLFLKPRLDSTAGESRCEKSRASTAGTW